MFGVSSHQYISIGTHTKHLLPLYMNVVDMVIQHKKTKILKKHKKIKALKIYLHMLVITQNLKPIFFQQKNGVRGFGSNSGTSYMGEMQTKIIMQLFVNQYAKNKKTDNIYFKN